MTMNQNRFILARAAAILVEAYGKLIPEYVQALGIKDLRVSKDAPNTYEALVAEFKEHKTLTVSNEHAEKTIYGFSGNMTFRIFHDLGHLCYDAQFTTADEVELANIQWRDLERYIPREWCSVCHAVYCADTVEQSLYEAECGEFPDDQKAFVANKLAQFFENRDKA